MFLCLHISELTNYKKATSQLSHTRHISVSKQSNRRSEKGANTISNAHVPHIFVFPLASPLLEMLCLLSHAYKPKNRSEEHIIFRPRAAVGNISLLDHNVGVSYPQEDNLVERKGRWESHHCLLMRPGGRPVLGQAPGLFSKPGPLGQCSLAPNRSRFPLVAHRLPDLGDS